MRKFVSFITSSVLAIGVLVAVAPSAQAAVTIQPEFAITDVVTTFTIDDITVPVDATCSVVADSDSVLFGTDAATALIVTTNFLTGVASIDGDVPIRDVGDEEKNVDVSYSFDIDCDSEITTIEGDLVDAFDYYDAPFITDISTPYAEVGDEIVIIGTDLEDVYLVEFGLSEAIIEDQGDSFIKVIVPNGGGTVDVRIEAYDGIEDSLIEEFTYSPTIESVTPATGGLGGGDEVRISGTGLSLDTVVKFGSTEATVDDVSDDGTELWVFSPARVSAGLVNVTVEDLASDSNVLTNGFRYVDEPTITSFTPSEGNVDTQVVVTGTNLWGSAEELFVYFGSAEAEVLSATGTTVTVVVPERDPEDEVDVDIRVETMGGEDTSSGVFTYIPEITALTPNRGPIGGGNVVVIEGNTLSDAEEVLFGAVEATIVSNTDTEIRVIAPAGSGTVSVTVVINGENTTLTNAYTYSIFTINSISPSTGAVAGGDEVTITGTGFSEDTRVRFGSTLVATANVEFVSSTQILVTTPAVSAGLVDVSVIDGASTDTLVNAFRFVSDPTITSFTPTTGPLGGGNSVTITGTNLYGDDDQLVVQFGTAEAEVVSTNGTTLVVLAPVKATADAAAVPITVTNASGSDESNTNYTYVTPTITSISPNSGPAAGGNIVAILGTNLLNATSVLFDTTTATILSNTNTRIEVIAPAGTGVADITVRFGVLEVESANAYTYSVFSITEITPGTGAVSGGQRIVITGTGFTDNSVVRFGSVEGIAPDATNGGRQLSVTTPLMATTGLVNVTVTDGANTATLENGFRFVATPTISNIAPATGPIGGGSTVVITGTGFFGDNGELSVKFGTADATILSTNGTTLNVTVPPKALTDALAVAVTVTNKAGSVQGSSVFTYVGPTLNPLAVPYGPISGGNVVTLTGTNLANAASVTFGTAVATIISNTATSIQVIVPAGANSVNVSVTIRGVSATLTNGYTYLASPSVTTITPGIGLLAGNTLITIQGSNLLGVTEVRFDGVAGTSLVVTSGTSLTVRTPSRLTAGLVNIAIYGPGGVTVLTNAFEYVTQICTPAAIGKVTFEKGSTKLTDFAKSRLQQFATQIAASGCETINLSHYFVKSAKTSLAKTFLELSQKRANKVKNFLARQLLSKGIEDAKISIGIKLVNQRTNFTTLDQFKVNRVVKITTVANS